MQRLCWIIQADSVQSRGPLQEEDRRVGVRVEVVTTEGEVRGQRERLEDPILLPLRGGRSRKLRSAGGPPKAGEDRKWVLPWSLQKGEDAADTSSLGLWPPELCGSESTLF